MRALIRRTVLLAAVLGGATAFAQQNYLRVYPWETPGQGWVELTLWNTWVAQSDVPYDRFGLDDDRTGLFAHALELEYGITDRLTLGAYADAENPPGGGFAFTRARVVGRYRLFDRYQYLFDAAIYAEYYLPRTAYGTGQELELRLILERDLGDFRVDVNPVFSKATSGDEIAEPLTASLYAGLYWRRFWRVQPGVEVFADFGGIGTTPYIDEVPVLVAPSLDVRITQGIWWHLSAAFGITDGSDRILARSILSWEYETIRPSVQVH